MTNENVQRQIFVSGRVQGVFFRDNCMQQARQLKLSGGVRNLQDGRVEVLVSGGEIAVKALIKWLKTGPKHAKVSMIDIIEITLTSPETKDWVGNAQPGQFDVWPTK